MGRRARDSSSILRFCLAFSAMAAAAPAAARAADGVAVKVVNPGRTPRVAEVIALRFADLVKLAPGLEAKKAVVVAGGGQPVDSQLVDMDGDEAPDELVFQVDLAPSEARTFIVAPGTRRPSPRDAFKVYGRFVRERHDDFAWENDRVAHRMYGPDLEGWKAEPLTSSGIDVWVKRVRKLVVNDWYMTDDYHRDNGEGADLYSVGKSRGCGGLGIWAGDQLHVSRNFVRSRVLANGPLRLVFELTYAPWEAGSGAVMVSETKRVVVDAGKHLDRYESTFALEDGSAKPLAVAVGIAKHQGGVFQIDRRAGWLRSWEPLKHEGGDLGCALVLPPAAVTDARETASDSLLVARARTGTPFVYHAGAAWSRGGDVADGAAWTRHVQSFARDLTAPPRITLAAAKVETAAAAPGPAPPAAAAADAAGARGPVRWSARTCDSVMKRGPIMNEKWAYDAAFVLKGCEQVWRATRERKYLDYVKQSFDRFVDDDGNIRGYKPDDYNIDNINPGKVLFTLYAEAAEPRDKERYRKAIYLLRAQMRTHPRTKEGGFWHKKIYPHQIWLDGIFMASPFLAQFAVTFDEPALLDDVARQVLLAERHTRDPRTGLLLHGWDESRTQRWADAKTGRSPQVWARAMGWYAMGVVDVLEQMPAKHPRRPALLAVLRRLMDAVARTQDPATGVWWQVLDAGDRPGNYREASASAMFAYALSKAARLGWIDAKKYGPAAERAYRGILDRFIDTDEQGQVSVKQICKVAGLGGDPYRDGSYEYYTTTEIATNDPKGVGAFIAASLERE